MALFKINKGRSENLPQIYREGYAYFTVDDGKFYIDTSNDASGRIVMNAESADFLGSLSEVEIRTLISDKLDADVVPIPTIEDVNKFLIVNDEGKYEISTVYAQDIMGTAPVLNENYPNDTNFIIKDDTASSTTLAIHITEQGSPAKYTYQWYRNNEPIIGATNSTYILPSDLENGVYTYYCEVTNVAGTVKSRESIVTVNRYYTPVLDNSYPKDVSKTVTKGGSISNTFEIKIATEGVPTEYTYQWYKDNSIINGATNSTYTAIEDNVQSDSSHTYYCKVTNAAGSVNSKSATFNIVHYYTPTLNASYPENVNKTVISGNTTSATFEVKIATAGKPSSYSYQWYENDIAIDGATSATYTKTGLAETGTYEYYCKVTNNGGTVQSRTATLSITKYYKPILNSSYPADVTTSVVKGNTTSATFEVKIATAGVPASYTYQWYVNDQAVTGETNATFTKTGLSTTANYSVYCMVTNTAGSVKSRVSTLQVTQYYTPVLNSTYPTDATLTVIKGNTVSNTFKVEVATAGVPASYTYQWYVNDTAVSGATSATYTKSDFATTATYSVYCKVTNAAGSVNSRTSTVQVTQYYTPVLNSSYPADVSVAPSSGSTASFKVEISTAGVPSSYTYQWYVNNSAISGATSSTYSHSIATTGTYNIYCKVTNTAGSVDSRTAVLEVLDPTLNLESFTGAKSLVENSGTNRTYRFTSTGTITPNQDYKVDIWGIGGGGAGNKGQGAGGGGGGYTNYVTGVTLKGGTTYTFTIGAGGSSAGAAGSATTVTGGGTTLFTANGGKGGGIMAGGAGGSGGGAGTYTKYNDGGYAGVGGTGGGNGGKSNSASGGAGSGQNMYPFRQNGTSGISSTYMKSYGGGGGGSERRGVMRAGGAYGGGAGEYQVSSDDPETPAVSGTANSGGGGGGAQGTTFGNGGSGLLMIRNAR